MATWSDETDKIMPALLAAQAAIPPLVKDKESQVRTKKGSYTVSYLELSTLMETVTPILNEQQLIHTSPGVEEEDGRTYVVVEIRHTSGQWYRGRLGIGHPPGEWEVGSALTFFRRYLLLCMLGVQPAGEDDMGRAAQKGRETAERHQTQRQAASAAEKAARDRRESEYRETARDAGLDITEAATTARGFASGAFETTPAELSGPQWQALLAHLRGALSAEWVETNVLLTGADRAKLSEYLGIEPESPEDRALAELESWAGPDVTVEGARQWARKVLDEDLVGMTGQRVATVKLWLKTSGHSAVQDALGSLGGGDMVTGVSRLWAELGDPGIVLEHGPEALVDKLTELVKEDAK